MTNETLTPTDIKCRLRESTKQHVSRSGWILLLLFPILTAFSFGQENNVEQSDIIQYRRWFVPEDRIDNSLFSSWSLPMSRQVFEQRIKQLERKAEDQNRNYPLFSHIILKARLEGRQLTAGTGMFILHSQSETHQSEPVSHIRLAPLSLAISAARWTDRSRASKTETEAVLHCDHNGSVCLKVPQNTQAIQHDMQFQWSLQSQRNSWAGSRSSIVFDIALPACLSIELLLELPQTLVPHVSAGLALPLNNTEIDNTAQPDSKNRTWRILLGHNSQITLTIEPEKSAVEQKSAVRTLVRHQITPKGLNTVTRIIFDGNDSRPDELFAALDAPLRPIAIKYGDQPVNWTKTLTGTETAEIRIDLSPFADTENRELIIEAMGPLQENKRWTLPRVRLTSSETFWVSTRCAVYVDSPLRTRFIRCNQSLQDAARSPFDWAEQELHVFQFFQDDAQVELEVYYSTPPVSTNSITQTDWHDSEIRSTVVLACSVTEGERFILNFPVSEHWIIDSITSYSPSPGTFFSDENPVLLWNMLDDKTLSIQLKRPLKPKSSVLLQLSCRFMDSAKNQFRLAELSPLTLTQQFGETHYIATQLNLADRTKYSAEKFNTNISSSEVPQNVPLGNYSLELKGHRYSMDSHSKEIKFELERKNPNYIVDISGSIEIGRNELLSAFRIRCTPVESSIDRVFVHFTPSKKSEAIRHETWSLVGESDSSSSIRSRKLTATEIKELQPFLTSQDVIDDLLNGEVWEIRLQDLRTTPFEISANTIIPLSDSSTDESIDSVEIPLVSCPLASTQQGKITVNSPNALDYQVIAPHLESLPIAPVPWDQYQHTHAAFRYDPAEELRRSHSAVLLLKKSDSDEQFASAWVWSLRLDSQYEPEGIVRNKTLFLLENRGKENLQITLPYGIDPGDVSVVWLDSKQVPWKVSNGQTNDAPQTIDVALPSGQRFVSIVLEYLYQDKPLARQRKLRPRYPSADVPILSGSWISWFPPEFDVSVRRDSDNASAPAENRFLISKALDYLTAGTTYRTYFMSKFNDLYYGEDRRSETESAAQYFFQSAAYALQSKTHATWGDLIGNEKVLSDIRLLLANDTSRVARLVETKMLIDSQALTFLGITPSTPIDSTGTIHGYSVRERFERAGLVLLVAYRTRSDGIKEYVFALTTPATLSLNRQLKPVSVGHCVRMVPFEFLGTVSTVSAAASSEMTWIPVARWLSETPLSAIPWQASAPIVQRSALTSDWNAYTLPMNIEQSLYIVHRRTMSALQWIAFLTLVLLSSRKPFSSPIVLAILLLLFEIAARSVAPCYAGIPSGAFLGVLAGIGFVLIRSQITPAAPCEPVAFTHRESTECSTSFVPTSLVVRSIIFFILLSVPAVSQTFTEKIQEYIKQKEPYSVIYPADSANNAEDQIYLPAELYDLLFRNVETSGSAEDVPQWNIVNAVYQGSLIFGTLGQLECSDDFKAVYDIHLDSSSATISLPNTLPVQGRYFWDSKPILPIDNTQHGTLSFLIENEKPGKHTLEIALLPKITQRQTGGMFQIAFGIPQVPNTLLRLNVPPEMPAIQITEAQGAITENTAISPMFAAELGTAPQVSLSWQESPNRNGTFVCETEQFFRIQAKTSQIELKALFRFQIRGGKVRYLTIQHDPRWTRSGQFQCDEHQLAQRLDTGTDLRPYNRYSETVINSPPAVSQIDFQTPVSGTITIRADYVFRDFSTLGNIGGIGNLRVPEFKALQSRITKSMLAVFADQNLEINGPAEGRSSGFVNGWQGTSKNFFAFTEENSFLEFAGSMLSGQSNPMQERPVVEYDLTQTQPNWTLNIRSKKTPPKVAVTQSLQFDTEESGVHILGEFTTSANVFKQYFTLDQPVKINTVEVWDTARNELIPSRCVPIDTAPEPLRYVIFFKTPAAQKYTITLRGAYKTAIQNGSVQNEPVQNKAAQPVPVLTFNEVQITDHVFNFFKTPSVIAEIIEPEQKTWIPSDAGMLPKDFTSFPLLGTWKRTNLTVPGEKNFLDVNQNENADIVNTNNANTNSGSVRFILLHNRPKVQCKTVLSLQPAELDDSWKMTADCSVNVASGELKSLHLHWDDRWGTIESIEPPVTQTFGQWEGKPMLILTPETPLTGEQKFKIVTALNISGTNVSLPNMVPLAAGLKQFESELFIDLPRFWNQEIIPWEMNFLETAEIPSEDDLRIVYKAVDPNFKVAINQMESKLTALFYDIGFLVRQRGSIIGSAMIDLRNRGSDSVIVKMPPGYELIQISSAGSLLDRTRLNEENRWKVNIGTNNYPQRLSILFRTSQPIPLKQWMKKQCTATIQFPVLEGVAVQETLWTVMFEGDMPALNVAAIFDKLWGSGSQTLPGILGNEITELGEHRPLSGRAAAISLLGINLIREYNLIRVLNTLPGTIPAQQEESQHWFAHWSEEWNTVADKVDFQTAHLPLAAKDTQPNLITQSVNKESNGQETTGAVAFVETMGMNTREALKDNKAQRVLEKFGASADAISKQSVPLLNSQVYWQGRISEKTQYLSGLEEGVIRGIKFTSIPDAEQWSYRLSEHTPLWISLGLLLPVLVLLSIRWGYCMELWLQFPHFWGMALGTLLWTFLPQSFIGLIVIALSFISLFRPSWRSYRTRQ